MTARLSVTAPHSAGGRITIASRWFGFNDEAGQIAVRGHLEARMVALATPGG